MRRLLQRSSNETSTESSDPKEISTWRRRFLQRSTDKPAEKSSSSAEKPAKELAKKGDIRHPSFFSRPPQIPEGSRPPLGEATNTLPLRPVRRGGDPTGKSGVRNVSGIDKIRTLEEGSTNVRSRKEN